jgi:hypothetical protein
MHDPLPHGIAIVPLVDRHRLDKRSRAAVLGFNRLLNCVSSRLRHRRVD